jgi:hypothetical protein
MQQEKADHAALLGGSKSPMYPDPDIRSGLSARLERPARPLRAKHNFAPGVPLFQGAIGLPDLAKREHLRDWNV